MTLLLSACNHSTSDNSVLLNISASGEIELVPDMASVTISIGCTNKDITVSNECAMQNIDKLFALFDEYEISKDDYHSSRVNLEKSYRWRNNSNVFDGYLSSSTVSVKFNDMDVMSKAITKILAMKNAEVFGLNYSHSKIDSIANEAYLKALGNARKLAEDIKLELKGKSISVLEVSNIDNKFRTTANKKVLRSAMAESRLDNSAASIQINPGMLKLVKDIHVLYSVKFSENK